MLLDLYSQRELIFTLVKRDLKVRYKASALGFLWSFGRPLFLMLVMWAVFAKIVHTGFQTEIPYALHLLTGILPWMYFQATIAEAQGSILHNASVVKKVALPTEAFPAATILSNLVHFFLALSMLVVFILGYVALQGPKLLPGWEIILLPVIVLIQTLILLGFALILSSLNVFYRDVGSISEIMLSAWFYMTPIIYPMQGARDRLKSLSDSDWLYYLYLCNPMTPIVVAYRRVFYGRYLRLAPEISDQTLLMSLGVSLAFGIAIFWFGARLFKRLSSRFADEL